MAARTALEELAADPGRAALFLDFDGVLAPIVPRPDDAAAPPETRRELARLAARYALVSVISGRSGDDVRRRIGIEAVVCIGSHGLDVEPEAQSWRPRIKAFALETGWPDTELKDLTVAFHFRNTDDEETATRDLERVAERARAEGLRARFGRKVLEVLPPLDTNKGTAVRRLVEDSGVRRALVAGDDTTDVDAFHAVDGLELAVRVAVATDESPAALRKGADVVVGTTGEFLELLRTL
ncbi:MAG: trehalose-phosphatase [Gaiellaceae bacterium]